MDIYHTSMFGCIIINAPIHGPGIHQRINIHDVQRCINSHNRNLLTYFIRYDHIKTPCRRMWSRHPRSNSRRIIRSIQFLIQRIINLPTIIHRLYPHADIPGIQWFPLRIWTKTIKTTYNPSIINGRFLRYIRYVLINYCINYIIIYSMWIWCKRMCIWW